MPIVPSQSDVEAGYTETLTAVAVRCFPDLAKSELPWVEIGNAGIEWPAELDRWLREVPGWEDHDVNYLIYVMPETEYRPLHQLCIEGFRELDHLDFLATPGEVASVRAASEGGEHQK